MHITLHWPQGIYVAITLVGLALSIANHGKPRSNENAWTTIIAVVITYSLLIWGGFFK
jgi:hypothetical protein